MNLITQYDITNHYGRELGMELNIIEPGKISYTLTISKKHLAIPNVAHGGVLAALVDGTLGVAALSLVQEDGKVVSTIEFKINYLKPAILGDVLIAYGEVIKKGKSIVFTSCKVENQHKETICTASGTFNSYPAEKVFSP